MKPQSDATEARRVPPPELPGRWPAQSATGAASAPGTDAARATEDQQRAECPEPAPLRWPTPPPAQEGPSRHAAPDPGVRAAAPGEPFFQPAASWRWPIALAGLIAGAAPQALLTIASVAGNPSPTTTHSVSTSGAIAVALGALLFYGWETLAAWLFSLRNAGRSLVLWGFRRPTRAYFWVVPLGLVAVYGFSIVHDLIVHPRQQAIVSEFPHSSLGATMFVLVAVIMAPLFEEIIFRGFLFRGFANSWGWLWGAIFSAAIFGAAHAQLDVFLPLASLGFVLAWAYRRTGSLWTCITMHAIFNLVAVAAWALAM